jgi:hypothetical protein
MKVGDLARVTIASLLGRKGDVVLILEVKEYPTQRQYIVLHQRTGQKRTYNSNFLEKIQ